MDKSWHREAVGVAYSSGKNLSIDLPNGLCSWFVLIIWRARRA
jgi:hypothetical protein